MALQKSLTVHCLPSSLQPNYIKYSRCDWNEPAQSISLFFDVYMNRAHREEAGALPVVRDAIRVNLTREKHDAYFSNALMSGKLFKEQAYAAAKAETSDMFRVSGNLLSDAQDV